jgi:hypothetical protein
MSRDNELLSGLKKYGMVAFDLSAMWFSYASFDFLPFSFRLYALCVLFKDCHGLDT